MITSSLLKDSKILGAPYFKIKDLIVGQQNRFEDFSKQFKTQKMKTSGNTVLITGGASGIGLALATRFLTRGNTVLIAGRDEQKLAMVKHRYPELDTFCCDLSDQQALNSLADYARLNYPNLNVLVNNAAVQYQYSFLEGDKIQKIEYEVKTNFIAPIILTSLLLSTLAAQSSAAIINVSSGLLLSPKKSASVYCATKAALHSFSKSLRYQLDDTKIKVFEIIPALVDTPMTEGRGKGKISSEELVNEFFKNLATDRYESYIGKAKILKLITRFIPSLADKLMKNS